MAQTQLTAPQVACIAKAIATKELDAVRPDLAEGTETDIDILVQITGSLKVGKSTTTHQVQALKPWRLFLASLSMLNGVSIEKLIRIADDMDSEAEKEQKEKVFNAAERLKGTVLMQRAAPIKFSGLVEGIV